MIFFLLVYHEHTLIKKKVMEEEIMIVHPIDPVFDKESKVLILGSFPSVKSREAMFFYGHPQNRFWKVIASIYDENIPTTLEEKKALLLRNHIAVWDVIASCDIEGSSDSSIKNVVPNDLSAILDNAQIKAIYVNGKTAEKYYRKYIEKKINRKAICLPSTSPANAAWNIEKLLDVWKCIKD
jgi:hypoxanthine-DNA glycosylase